MDNAFFKQTLALTNRELKHWYRSKMQIAMALIQPLLWLGLFGTMMTSFVEASGVDGFFNFLAMGMIVITALSTAMSSGMSLIWDRRFGFLDKIRAAPIPRGVIPLSRVLATSIKAIFQCTVVFLVALAMGLEVTAFGVWSIPVFLLVVIGVSLTFSSLFVAMGLIIKSQEVFMGVNMLLMMPLMFVSGAMFPLSMMSSAGAIGSVLVTIAELNPLTFAADALRSAFVGDAMNALSYSMGTDILILMIVAIVVTSLGMFFARRALKVE